MISIFLIIKKRFSVLNPLKIMAFKSLLYMINLLKVSLIYIIKKFIHFFLFNEKVYQLEIF